MIAVITLKSTGQQITAELKEKETTCLCHRDMTLQEFRKIIQTLRGEKVDENKVVKIFPNYLYTLTDTEKEKSFLNELNTMFRTYKIESCLQKAHFLGQSYAETGRFNDLEEVGVGDDAYEGFKGRGILQLTKMMGYFKYFDYCLNDFILKKKNLKIGDDANKIINSCINNGAYLEDFFTHYDYNKKIYEKFYYFSDKHSFTYTEFNAESYYEYFCDSQIKDIIIFDNKITNEEKLRYIYYGGTMYKKLKDKLHIFKLLLKHNLYFAVDSAGWYWSNNFNKFKSFGGVNAKNENINIYADKDDCGMVTECINGPARLALKEREQITNKVKEAIGYDKFHKNN